jgi:hypothetical protein
VNWPRGTAAPYRYGPVARVTLPRPETSVTVAEWNWTGPAYKANPRAVGSGGCTYLGMRSRDWSPRYSVITCPSSSARSRSLRTSTVDV